MRKIFIHEHAFKHGITEVEIREAWNNFVAMRHREMPKEDQIVAVGFCAKRKKAIQMIAIDRGDAILIYHAMTPPQKSVIKELGLN